MTPSMLAVILCSQGYVVSLRCLTDWRAKGLLPRLQTLGLGRGRGVLRYWNEANIVQRAIHAYKAMRETGRARSTLISLFSSGYICASNKVREAYKQNLRCPAFVSRQPLHGLAKRLAKAVPRLARHSYEICDEILRIVSSDGWQPGRQIKFDLLVEFTNRFLSQVSHEKRPPPINERELQKLIDGIRSTISFVGLANIVANSTDQDLHSAQASWCEFFAILDGAIDAVSGLGNAAQLDELHKSRLSELLAPIGIPLILPMRAP